MKVCATLFLAAAAVVLSAAAAHACTCAPTPSVAVAREQAAAVFSGRVVKVRRVDPPSAPGAGLLNVEVVFAVTHSWKGVESPTVSVFTSSHGASCGYGFRTGRTYLVYAYRQGDGPLSTGICGRTRRLKDAREDLKELGAAKAP